MTKDKQKLIKLHNDLQYFLFENIDGKIAFTKAYLSEYSPCLKELEEFSKAGWKLVGKLDKMIE